MGQKQTFFLFFMANEQLAMPLAEQYRSVAVAHAPILTKTLCDLHRPKRKSLSTRRGGKVKIYQDSGVNIRMPQS